MRLDTETCWGGPGRRVWSGGPEWKGAGRSGRDRFLRGRLVPLSAGPGCGRFRCESVRPGRPPSARQVRLARCRERGPGSAEWAGARPGQDGRRAGGDRPDVQAGQGLGGQGPHPGDQPAQGRPHPCRSAAEGGTGRAGQRRALPHLRTALSTTARTTRPTKGRRSTPPTSPWVSWPGASGSSAKRSRAWKAA